MDEIAGRAACAPFRRSTSRWVRYRRLTVKFTMLGVRFLDVDFMRINLACAPTTVCIIRLSCIVEKGRTPHGMHRDRNAEWRRRGGARHEGQHEPRGQPYFILPSPLYIGPR